MNISAWSIRNPVPAILLFALATLLGLQGFHKLGIQDFPDIDFPTVTVTASLQGAAPGQMETEVARKIENAVASLSGVKHIRSTITEGTATIAVEFEVEKNLSEAMDDVRDAVSRTRSDLPADLLDPVVSKVSTTGKPLITCCVASDHLDEEGLSWFVDDTVEKSLLAVPGVGAVKRLGGVDREIRVELDAERMDALGVTAADVSRQIGLVHLESSGGRGDVGGIRQSVRAIITGQSASDLAALVIPLGDGRRIHLDQVAHVIDGGAERTSIILLDGRPVVGFDVTRSRGASEVTVIAAVRAAIAKLNQDHPQAHISEAFDTVGSVLESYSGSMELLFEGGLLAILVVWWFLRDARATLIAATALPLSIIPTFVVMQWLGFSLNTVSLLAMALVVGVLVDDAIVEIENIERHLRMGKPPFQAAMDAADEIGLAVIATTFTLIAVFLPTAFMGGIPGKFFTQFGWTAGIAVAVSLLVARLLTPMMAAYLLKPNTRVEPESRVMRGYLRVAGWCVGHRWWTLAGAGLLFVASMSLVPLLSTSFLPQQDRGQTAIGIELAPGSTLDQTRAVAEMVRLKIADLPEITRVFTNLGGDASGGDPNGGTAVADVRKATLTLCLTPRQERMSQVKVESLLRQRLDHIPGVRISVGGSESGEKLELVLAGNEANTLLTTANAVQRDLRTIPGLGNISSDASLLRPEIQVTPDQARAADLGVTTAAMMEVVRVATTGDFDTKLAKLNLPGRQVPIRVQMAQSTRSDLAALARLRVAGAGGSVLLGAVAQLDLGSGPAEIDRLDRVRRVTISAELNGQQLGAVQQLVDSLPSIKALPPGVVLSPSGDAEREGELFSSFGGAMAIGLLCIYIVLVLLFHDFLQPLTILAALPLAVGGALTALLIGHFAFSMPSIIGLLMLMGIVTKNSILLVDYAIMARREHGLDRSAALLDACRKRARPIVMTTLAMGIGMLPIALGWSAEPSFRAPMATAVIGGLVTSTLLSLLVIPAVFTVVDDVLPGLKRIFGKGRRTVTVQPPTVSATSVPGKPLAAPGQPARPQPITTG